MTAELNKRRLRKSDIRARMERTGESYMVAMHALVAGKPEPARMTDVEVLIEYGDHLGLPDPAE